jgi:hypothetical protein
MSKQYEPFKQYEIRRVPRRIVQGGDAIAQQCLGKWVHLLHR